MDEDAVDPPRDARARAGGEGQRHEDRGAGGDLGGVLGPVDEQAERRDDEGDLDDDRHRAADQLEPLPGDAGGAEVGLVGGGQAQQQRASDRCRDRGHGRHAVASGEGDARRARAMT